MAEVIHKKWCAYASNKIDLCTCGSAPALHWLGYCAKHECRYDENDGCELCREEHEMTGTKLDESAFCDKCGEHKDQAHACWNTETPRHDYYEIGMDAIESPLQPMIDKCQEILGKLKAPTGAPVWVGIDPAEPGADSTVVFDAPADFWPRHPDCKNHLFSEEPGCAWCQNQFELDGMRDMRSTREKVLQRAIDLTAKNREQSYGSPEPNLTLQMELWTLYKATAGDKHSLAHDAAMQHVFAKIARIASGPPLHEDNYVDLSGYAALAYECDVQVLGVES